MKRKSIRNKLINISAGVAVVLFAAIPTYANAHTLVFDHTRYDANEFNQNQQECAQLMNHVGQNEGTGAIEQGVKRGARGATVGAIAGSISGNSGSSAAKKGAAVGTTVGMLSGKGSQQAAEATNQKERNDLMRNCMQDRGYSALN
ncbi:hypothetical protein BCU68_04290 [Vibrio sp. 10N.286.49.B3]|uniref:glycine zipper family protein n=1 Tax=Vibrio sp. 10N.286.49.B3 TaxID=1880855 RepID=UPI000C82206B|nr:glycine zipper family protein [Vibrio sp. 10N.286.49.B3]PMH43213.1 hypothetical protein BCU68_04290 [Vibrio sp. 10N.286.49.B3]